MPRRPPDPGRPAWAATRTTAVLVALVALSIAVRAEDEALSHITPDLTALSRLGKAPMSQPPPWVAGNKSGMWSIDDIAAEFGKVTDKPPRINFSHDAFVRPDHRWLLAYREWFQQMLKSLKLEYRDDVFDCDNFARTFVAFANMVALRSGETQGSLCVGWATVANDKAFGGVPGSTLGLHSLVVVGTSEGLFVIEPQTGKMASLRDYPNRDGFQDLNL